MSNEIKALLVDDVELNLKVLLAMLKRLKVTAIASDSGAAALGKMKEWIPDMVLTNMWMPKMNGEELVRAIRLEPAYEKVRIFAVTADIEVKTNFNMTKFDGVLFKPVSMDKLKEVIFPNL